MRAWWVALLVLVACGGEPGIAVETWRVVEGPGAGSEVHIPLRLDDLDAPARFVLRAEVDLPEAYLGQSLSLAIPALRSPAELRAAGDEMSANVASDDWLRRSGAQLWRIPAAYTRQSPLRLDLAVTAGSRADARMLRAPRLSRDPAGDAHYRAVRRFNAFASPVAPVVLCGLALFHVLLWLFDRRQTAYGWFSLQGLAATVYALLVAGTLSDVLGPAVPALAGVALCSSATGAVYFTHRQFGLGRVPRYVPVSWAAVVVGALIVSRDAFVADRYFAPCYFAQGIVCVLYSSWTLGRRVLGPATNARDAAALLLLAAWGSVGLASLPDILAVVFGVELLGGVRILPLGTALFAALQAVALGVAHARLLRDSQRLNEELRRRIQERSRAIQLSLGSRRDDLDTPDELGQVFENRYRLLRPLGLGGMGQVSEVEQLADGRRLALKRLRASSTPEALARFAREAEIAASFQHPNLVSIVDVDVAEGGGLFLVMELVSGGSLRDAQRHFGERRWGLRILEQVAAGLAELHRHGIVHRDLKPANVLLEEPDSVSRVVAKISDFGISMLLPSGPERTLTAQEEGLPFPPASHDSDPLTRTGMLLGTPLYMAPEQAADARDATPASDVYSFALLAYEVLSGSRITRERDREAFAAMKPPLPAQVRDLLMRCLDPDPARRPRAAELEAALRS